MAGPAVLFHQIANMAENSADGRSEAMEDTKGFLLFH
jgi:hypothetical protein